MSDTDHRGKKKIQCWIDQDVWDLIESLGYTSPTVAVTEAFNRLIDESRKDPLQIPDESQRIPELRATIEGLQLLLQEKDQRIEDLRKDKETLSIFAHYFKSLEYKRIESQGQNETARAERQEGSKEEHREERTKQEKNLRRDTGHGEKERLLKECKYCGKSFNTYNDQQIYCCKEHKDEAYNEKRRKERREKITML